MMDQIFPGGFTIDWTAVGLAALALLLAVAIAYVFYRIVFAAIDRLTSLSETTVDEMIVEKIRRPVKWSFIALSITIVAQINPDLQSIWEPLAKFLRPALLGWIAYTLVKAFTAAMEFRLDASDDPVAVRSRRTRVAVLSRTATFAIIFITVGLMLLGIPAVRDIGTTLLASAGLAALAVGAAAQPALKSLIAGLQVALTEPMRLGDLVKVDGEVGRIEEIRMSFVTVRTWDERVLVVPTSRFLDESFENWSRQSEKLTGPVFLHLDPATEVAPIRAEFERYVSEHALFDGRNKVLLMTEAYPESIELRLSMSSKTIGDLWALRCDVREHMISWLRTEMPDALIRHRLEVPHGHPKAGEP
ncbi:mechanosensitive ion channel family protein [Qipengyuania sp. DGS5-3]|uniref:mechanosensitive ion channel family protein n=1 Tax=Qipengyuania sp. DGS5-3 TaxID=3349632 RepID=UPI0036D29C5B